MRQPRARNDPVAAARPSPAPRAEDNRTSKLVLAFVGGCIVFFATVASSASGTMAQSAVRRTDERQATVRIFARDLPLTLVLDLPLQGLDRAQTEQMVRAIPLVLERSEGRAGKYRIRFESHDVATPAAGKWHEPTCARNARSYVSDETVVGVIGTYNSGCAAIEVRFPYVERLKPDTATACRASEERLALLNLTFEGLCPR